MKQSSPHSVSGMTRRSFLSTCSASAAGLLLGTCGDNPRSDDERARVPVAVAQVGTYNSSKVLLAMQSMLDAVGGLRGVVSPGDRIGVKVNLTGGVTMSGDLARPFIECHWTHPVVVDAVVKCLRDAGAGSVSIMDGLFDDQSYAHGEYTTIAQARDAQLVDLCNPAPYKDFIIMPVGNNYEIYPHFRVHPLLNEIDVLVSISKMKCHFHCGVTHTLKNHVGIVPIQGNQLAQFPGYRSALHGTETDHVDRLPGVINDLNRMAPIHLAVVDGVKTSEGGEGPWHTKTFGMVDPGVLVAGTDAVAVDSVATAAMGFDPEAKSFEVPFVNGRNHLAMAAKMGLGTNRLAAIDIKGPAIQDIRCAFKPCNHVPLEEQKADSSLACPYGNALHRLRYGRYT